MCAGQGLSAVGGHYTTRFKNAHGTVFRELFYHWHPWFGMRVAIHETVHRADDVVFRCTLSGIVTLLGLPTVICGRKCPL